MAPLSQGSSPNHSDTSTETTLPSSSPMQAASRLSNRGDGQSSDRRNGGADGRVQVITSKDEPFVIVWASEAWLQLCGYSRKEVIGRTLDVIEGPQTSEAAYEQLLSVMRAGQAVTLPMVNHTRAGHAFSHMLRVEPLCDTSGARQCYQVTSADVELHPMPQKSAKTKAEATPSQPSPQPSPSPSPQLRGSGMLARIPSDLKINEMLDLFDARDSSILGSEAFAEFAAVDELGGE